MQSTFRILSEMDGTLAPQLPAAPATWVPRLPHANVVWLGVLLAGLLVTSNGSFDFSVRLSLAAVAALHALGCVFFTFAQNDRSSLTWCESVGLFLPVAAITWTLPVLSMTLLADAALWQPGLTAISAVICLAMFLLYWPLRLCWTTGNSFGTSFCQVVLANLIVASPLSVVFALALGLAAWLT